ncbi:bifunctional (p)ppGpp synthetase/guanosine-3',5'-bis(diphosphate) 3'-pyrophosphohydrolase [Candidatus Beckwithbacteria bacterium]|nr:bifunctional (p)ppGpp synthetase/guanosine-3',5'-bis(diphosphate) 3'-pyrophosphohydrolase [Candidatus Beckwithbacteria bacterium]
MDDQQITFFSPLIENAIRLASFWHSGQMRKLNDFEYFTHPVSVAMILTRTSSDDELIAAAFCHDLLEETDCPDDEIINACGEDVFNLVKSVSDDFNLDRDRDWEKRKELYIQKIKEGSEKTKLLCCADKIHNIQTLIASLEEFGMNYFSLFHRGPEKMLWYYDTLCLMLQQTLVHPLVQELDSLLDQFVELLEILDKEEKEGVKRSPLPIPDEEKLEYEENNNVEEIDSDASLQFEEMILGQEELAFKQQGILPIKLKDKTKKIKLPKSKYKYLNKEEVELLLPNVLNLCIKNGNIDNKTLQENLQVNYLLAHRILKELKRQHIIDRADSFKPRKVNKTKTKELLKDFKKDNEN